jgi:hypothetical protein
MHKIFPAGQIGQFGHKNVNVKLNYDRQTFSPKNVKPKILYDRVDISQVMGV